MTKADEQVQKWAKNLVENQSLSDDELHKRYEHAQENYEATDIEKTLQLYELWIEKQRRRSGLESLKVTR
jgi:hypothetical protein